MDFWSRLIGGPTSPKTPPNLNNPHHRLAAFKRTYNNLLQIWHNGDGDYTDAFVAERARICLRRLSELLNDDGRGPTPHLCISFAATSRLLVIVAKVASAFHNDGITHEALGICSLLIDNEEEAFLEDWAFADILPKLIEGITLSSTQMIDQETESSMVEVLFGIASKIRMEPQILPVWFRPSKVGRDTDSVDETAVVTSPVYRLDEFPLFYLMLQYVPSEGRAGEFARMGLLYIIESASASEALERWIIEGDMAALMASGLGALYSQLSRKLIVTYSKAETPAILAFSGRLRSRPLADAEETTSADYQNHLATFLASLVFWQDLLDHCTSVDIKQTLLDHFRFLFLQQLLYPSLLESSDIDGGSSVAVLTYLRHIFESIDHPDLVRLTLQYLFGLREKPIEAKESAKPISVARRRKSQDLLNHIAKEEDQPTPDLFNLGDLILAGLRSSNQQTIDATLHLLSVLLRRQHHQVSSILLRTRHTRDSEDQRTVGAQEKEVDNFFALAERLTGFQDLESSFENHLYDNRNLLELHSCTSTLLSLPCPSEDDMEPFAIKSGSQIIKPHVLIPEDPILKNIVELLEVFFHNDIETNLGLTKVVVDLALCGNMRLEGWLLTHPSKYSYSPDHSADDPCEPHLASIAGEDSSAMETETLRRLNLARREPSWTASDLSPIFKVLDQLVKEVEAFRREINEFDTYLMQCRNTVEIPDNVSASGSNLSAPRKSQDSSRSSPTRLKNVVQIGSITERLRSDRPAGGPESRTSSPRGRQLDVHSTPTLVGRLGHLRVSPTRNLNQAATRNYSPSPLRKDPVASTPPRLGRSIPSLAAALQSRIWVSHGSLGARDGADSVSDTSSIRSESVGPEKPTDKGREVSIGHLMTNVIILQEFILELSALVEVRGGMFREVRYI